MIESCPCFVVPLLFCCNCNVWLSSNVAPHGRLTACAVGGVGRAHTHLVSSHQFSASFFAKFIILPANYAAIDSIGAFDMCVNTRN